MASEVSELKPSRRRLARIRCLKECVDLFKNNEKLPHSLCYIPCEVEYKLTKPAKVVVYSSPDKQSKKLTDFKGTTDQRLTITGEELSNSQGQWGRLTKVLSTKNNVKQVAKTFNEDAWILMYSSQSTVDESPIFTPLLSHNDGTHSNYFRTDVVNTWEGVIEHEYSVQLPGLKTKRKVCAYHKEGTSSLRLIPNTWTLEHDEDLAQFLCAHIEQQNDTLGSIKNFVETIDVSSISEEDEGVENLTDGDPDTYWESDGSQSAHWIRMKMKKGTIVKKLFVTIDSNDDNYMPCRFHVYGGELEDLKRLNDVTVDQTMYGVNDIALLDGQNEHHPIIEIRIKECKDDGIDTRIHGIKIKSTKERDLGLNKDLFSPENLVRYPKLENIERDSLYRRALVLQRFITLLDSVLPYMVPSWEYSTGSYSSLEVVRQLLPMSQKRMSLIETFLRDSETCRPSRMPKLYINRRAAAEHKSDPSQDPECKNTVFNQIYEGLKPRDKYTDRTLDYRWPARYDQWWECKFLAEGIIDQGGGFRDSLSDLADELCPSDNDAVVPLPHFIRAPNQKNADMNVNRDVYVPNPSCDLYHQYEWIGKLMGACLRGKESLVLALPAFVWKKLAGERVTWARDYCTVDEAEVKMMENMAQMDEDSFLAYFGEERTWSTVLSDGSTVGLRRRMGSEQHGEQQEEEEVVHYDDRLEYSRLVQAARMAESEKQLSHLRAGLLSVVPQAVLDLLTWQELERRICGDPEITITALKRTTHYEDMEEDDTRIQHMWTALNNFSNEDRSRFLRFVTGRRRLPAPLYICPDKGDSTDVLPESSTCSNTLYLPCYTSAKMCEEKLRYAAYNCIAIDTDMSPWDE